MDCTVLESEWCLAARDSFVGARRAKPMQRLDRLSTHVPMQLQLYSRYGQIELSEQRQFMDFSCSCSYKGLDAAQYI